MNKSIVIVGSAGVLLDTKLGELIDTFDEVARINTWATTGFEDIAGNKTTIWSMSRPSKSVVLNAQWWTGKRGIPIQKVKDEFSKVDELWCNTYTAKNHIRLFTPEWHDSRKQAFMRIFKLKNKIIRKMSIEACKQCCKDVGTNTPLGGSILIWLLLQTYDKIYICGFDCWQTDTRVHYYDNKKIERIGFQPDHQEMNYDQDYINKHIENGRIILLNKDTKIEKSKLITEVENYQCQFCGKTSYLYNWETKFCNYCDEK